jgi:hypothetical protein
VSGVAWRVGGGASVVEFARPVLPNSGEDGGPGSPALPNMECELELGRARQPWRAAENGGNGGPGSPALPKMECELELGRARQPWRAAGWDGSE